MNRRWVVPAFAVILALVTTAVVVGYVQTLQHRVGPTAPPVAMADVVVAKRTIPTRHIIGAADLAVRRVPASAVHPRALRNVGDGISKVAVTEIFEGEQIISDMVAPASVGASLSYVVPSGMRAMTIGVNEVVDVAGFVAPGDRVDIVGTVTVSGSQETSRIFLQNALVLAIAQQPDQQPGQPPKVTTSVTLALAPDQIEALTEIDNSGKVRLALRPAGSTGIVETWGQTAGSALNRLAAPVAPRAAAADPVTIVRPSRTITPPPSHTIEIWRSTQKQTVNF